MPSSKATKASQKRSDQALTAFHSYYTACWGEERWHQSLFAALAAPTRYCLVMNRYAPVKDVNDLLGNSRILPGQVQQLKFSNSDNDSDQNGELLKCFAVQSIQFAPSTESRIFEFPADDTPQFPQPMKLQSQDSTHQLLSHWNMDAASVLAANMLDVRPGDRVLDLCAAPGGKSIVLAQQLWPELHDKTRKESSAPTMKSLLHSNESDSSRNKRLEANLKSYLPPHLFSGANVKVLKLDASEKRSASVLPLGEGGYDKVLVDAPCSSERHIVHAWKKASRSGQIADELANWKSSHSNTLARTQSSLLMTALRAARIGGKVVYATCSISSEENDGVIERVLEAVKKEQKKNTDGLSKRWKVSITSFEDRPDYWKKMTEPTKYGFIALPDNVGGGRWGPLYSCLLEKIPYTHKAIQETTPDDTGTNGDD